MWHYPALLLTLITGGPADSLQGRWDLTLATANGNVPSWLEVEHSGRDALVGRFVGIFGSARPISQIVVQGDSFHFEIPHQWEAGAGSLIVDGRLEGDRLVGRMTFPDRTTATWTGTRAPLLHRSGPPQWGSPIRLLHQGDLGGWHTQGNGTNQWQVKDGVLRSPRSGENLVTNQTFTDFKLHIEFRYPAGSNSGVYLRGRYEVQILDDFGKEPAPDGFSAIYGFIEPVEVAARRPGAWQSYDVTLVGRRVTVVANGRRVICDREIPGITGGALDSNEAARGPILLQGDHGAVEFRNITLRVGTI